MLLVEVSSLPSNSINNLLLKGSLACRGLPGEFVARGVEDVVEGLDLQCAGVGEEISEWIGGVIISDGMTVVFF